METDDHIAHDASHDDVSHDDFGGLHRDIRRPIDRRRALQLIGGAGLVGVLAACDSSGSTSSPGSTATSATSATSASATSTSTASSASTGTVDTVSSGDTSSALTAGEEIPDETGGPYPADGTNGPNVLVETGIERNDITTSFGDLSGTAAGIPTRFDLQVIDAATGVPISGAAVYLWHCTAEGRYSIYEVTDQNFLRGIQATDADGVATFTSVYPGCYDGRWPHVHFEIYESIEAASTGSAPVKTSQLALPEDVCSTVYADGRYGDSAGNLSRTSLASDNVFADGWDDQLATMSGSNDAGYAAAVLVRV
jgi:protocatechuate 3,4-dioxygenase beta subunit